MKKNSIIYRKWIFLYGFFTVSIQIYASELVYQPVNPSFGSNNAYNAQWLMNEAQAQNDHELKSDFTIPKADPIEDFKESLNRMVLSQFSQKIAAAALGDTNDKNALKAGTFQLGDFTVTVNPQTTVIKILILDNVKGSQTTLEIPIYKP